MMTYLVLGVGGAAVIAVIGFVLLVWRGFAQNWRPEELGYPDFPVDGRG